MKVLIVFCYLFCSILCKDQLYENLLFGESGKEKHLVVKRTLLGKLFRQRLFGGGGGGYYNYYPVSVSTWTDQGNGGSNYGVRSVSNSNYYNSYPSSGVWTSSGGKDSGLGGSFSISIGGGGVNNGGYSQWQPGPSYSSGHHYGGGGGVATASAFASSGSSSSGGPQRVYISNVSPAHGSSFSGGPGHVSYGHGKPADNTGVSVVISSSGPSGVSGFKPQGNYQSGYSVNPGVSSSPSVQSYYNPGPAQGYGHGKPWSGNKQITSSGTVAIDLPDAIVVVGTVPAGTSASSFTSSGHAGPATSFQQGYGPGSSYSVDIHKTEPHHHGNSPAVSTGYSNHGSPGFVQKPPVSTSFQVYGSGGVSSSFGANAGHQGHAPVNSGGVSSSFGANEGTQAQPLVNSGVSSSFFHQQPVPSGAYGAPNAGVTSTLVHIPPTVTHHDTNPAPSFVHKQPASSWNYGSQGANFANSGASVSGFGQGQPAALSSGYGPTLPQGGPVPNPGTPSNHGQTPGYSPGPGTSSSFIPSNEPASSGSYGNQNTFVESSQLIPEPYIRSGPITGSGYLEAHVSKTLGQSSPAAGAQVTKTFGADVSGYPEAPSVNFPMHGDTHHYHSGNSGISGGGSLGLKGTFGGQIDGLGNIAKEVSLDGGGAGFKGKFKFSGSIGGAGGLGGGHGSQESSSGHGSGGHSSASASSGAAANSDHQGPISGYKTPCGTLKAFTEYLAKKLW